MTKRPTLTAREYLRVSVDNSGIDRSIDEQHDENAAAAAVEGWKLGTPYKDTGSASRKQRKARDGFDLLMADLDAGKFGADILLLWESSRGSRQVGEWVTLIDVCERHGVRIAVTTHGPRVYDPANERDRRSLLEDAVDSEYEAAKLGKRLKRASAANALKGRPHGRTPYGYVRTFDPKTGKLIGQEPDPVEAAIVVEVFERLAAGHSLRSISTDLEARGIRSRDRTTKNGPQPGRPFATQTLRPMVLNPLYCGQRWNAPNAKNPAERQRTATVVDSTWEPLVSRELYLTVKQRLTDPARRTQRPGRGVHLLSMIARCGVCDAPLIARYNRGHREYACRAAGHVRILADDVDAAAESAILGLLANPAQVEKLLPVDEVDDGTLEAARELVLRVRAEIRELAAALGRGELSPTLAGIAEKQLDERLVAAQKDVDALASPPTLRALIEPGENAAAEWREAPMSVRRELARMLLVPEVIGELRVVRSGSAGHRLDPALRITFRYTEPGM